MGLVCVFQFDPVPSITHPLSFRVGWAGAAPLLTGRRASVDGWRVRKHPALIELQLECGRQKAADSSAESRETAQNRSLSLTATGGDLGFQAVSGDSARDERTAGRKERNWPQKNANDAKNSGRLNRGFLGRRGWKRVNPGRRKKTKSFNMDEQDGQDGKSNLNLSCASCASMFNLFAPSDAV
jgi:hypothetical protein